MSRIFFTADLHFWHSGALRNDRVWASSVEEMNARIISEWNKTVEPTDKVYILGDLSFAGLPKTVECLGQLRGHLHVVPGNHDDRKMMRKLDGMGLIRLEEPLMRLKGEGWRVELCHFPLLSWNLMHHGAMHLHGHCHGNLADWGKARRLDVGIDANFKRGWGIAPVTLERCLEHLRDREGEYPDHHVPK